MAVALKSKRLFRDAIFKNLNMDFFTEFLDCFKKKCFENSDEKNKKTKRKDKLSNSFLEIV